MHWASHLDVQDAVGHADRVHLQGKLGRRRKHVAGRHVEFGTVTHANNLRAIQIAFGEGTLLVRARVVKGVVRAVDIRDSDPRPVNLDQRERASGYVAGLGPRYRFTRHAYSPPWGG